MITDPVELLETIKQEILKTDKVNSEYYNKLLQAYKDLYSIISNEDRVRAELIDIKAEMDSAGALENGIIPRIL